LTDRRVVVVTGSTRGIGHGLAEEFLRAGCSVVVCGRSEVSTAAAVERLSAVNGSDHVDGIACDVTSCGEVQALWDRTQGRYGRVDIWVNNAGVAHPMSDVADLAPATVESVVNTNIAGTVYGAKVAIAGMLQQGFGAVYNMEGLGSDGRRVRGLALYGASKRAVRYLTDSLVAEMEGTPVLVGSLSPGMVATDMLSEDQMAGREISERSRRVMNLLSDRVETVTPWLVRKMLDNDRHGVRLAWLTPGKVMWRFATSPFVKREILS